MFKLSTHALDSSVTTCLLVPQTSMRMMEDINQDAALTSLEFAHTCVATKSSLNQLRIRKAFSAHVQTVQQHTWVALRSILMLKEPTTSKLTVSILMLLMDNIILLNI